MCDKKQKKKQNRAWGEWARTWAKDRTWKRWITVLSFSFVALFRFRFLETHNRLTLNMLLFKVIELKGGNKAGNKTVYGKRRHFKIRVYLIFLFVLRSLSFACQCKDQKELLIWISVLTSDRRLFPLPRCVCCDDSIDLILKLKWWRILYSYWLYTHTRTDILYIGFSLLCSDVKHGISRIRRFILRVWGGPKNC